MKSKITTLSRERLEQYAEGDWPDNFHVGIKEMARALLAVLKAEPLAFTDKHEISNMEATGLYLRAWPADRRLNEMEGYTIGLYSVPPLASDQNDLAAAVNRLLEVDGSRGTFSAIRRSDALEEVECLLAAAPAPGGD